MQVVYILYPDECCPRCISDGCARWIAMLDRTLLGRVFAKVRMFNFKLVEHNYFETFIIVMILASSLALVCFIVSIVDGPEMVWFQC